VKLMRVFIYEFTVAAADIIPSAGNSLRTEGQAMLAAVLEDFTRVAGVEAVTLVAANGGELAGHLPQRRVIGDEAKCFRALAAGVDYTLVIAPEGEDTLETRCRWALEAGCPLLGPSPAAVRLTGDKWQLGRVFQDHGIPTPTTVCLGSADVRADLPAADRLAKSRVHFPLVVKPRHGAGSQATFFVPRAAELAAALARFREEVPEAEILVQGFAPGWPVSVAFLTGPGRLLALLPAAQHISPDGRCRYRGGRIPLPSALAGRATALARRAVQAVPGLQGYIGVDLVLGPANDGSQDQVLEINPRLTTSYIGLRALAQTNLAETMLRLVQARPVPEIGWRSGAVEFSADGSVAAVS
jgi:predicted ATP-grasp superfamily ATP-dependent carboligase